MPINNTEEKDKTFYSPELEALKKSLLARDWFQSPYQNLYMEQYSKLNQPENIQPLINTARANIAGQTKAGIQEAQRATGTRGFAAGESGIADRAIQNAIRAGQQTLGQTIGQITGQAQQNELAKSQLATQLLNSLQTTGQEGALQALQLGGGLEQAQQQFGQQQIMDFLNMLMGLYGTEQQSQLARYSPYWSGLSQIYGG